MDKRSLLAVVLCLGIFVAWQKFYIEPRLPKKQTQPIIEELKKTQEAPAVTTGVLTAPTKRLTKANVVRESKIEKIEIKDAAVTISDKGWLIQDWEIRNYRTSLDKNAPFVKLSEALLSDNQLQIAFDDKNYAYLAEAQGQLTRTGQEVRWEYKDEQVNFKKVIRFTPDESYFDLEVSGDFYTPPPKAVFFSVLQRTKEGDPEIQDRMVSFGVAQEAENFLINDTIETKTTTAPAEFISASNRDFTLALVPIDGTQATGLLQPINGSQGARLSLSTPVEGTKFKSGVRVYFGPKDLKTLRSVNPKLDLVIDFGFFTTLAYLCLKLLIWFYEFSHNYGMAIIFMTILLRIVTFPLSYKSIKSMKQMAVLAPEIKKLQERHKDDREGLNRAMLTFMKTHKYNPMAGCWPILIQMPIFIALYRVLYSSVELYQAPFYFWIHDLSIKDPFYVLPALVTLTMYLQQKYSPQTITDPAQQKMMKLMPLIFGAMMFTLPSGLSIYILVSTVLGILQQFLVNKMLGDTTPAPSAKPALL